MAGPTPHHLAKRERLLRIPLRLKREASTASEVLLVGLQPKGAGRQGEK